MIDVQITSARIPLEELLTSHADPSHGAQVVFAGQVRDHNQGQKVLGVSYDAFVPLAKKVLQEICAEAKNKWGAGLKAQVWHRTGRLQIGEVSVAIVVSSRHRDEAYLASRYIIEELKNRAPVWKREHYEGGDSGWLQGHALCGHGHADPHGPGNQLTHA